jgi:anti-sigma factor RsiW
MKSTEQLLDLQAYVDGELPAERRRQVEAALPADLNAQELVTGLRQLGTLIRAHEPTATVPVSREFYWSQIRRQIDAEQPKAPAASAALGWLRWLIPAMGVAAVAVVVSTQKTPREITLAGGGDVTVVDVSSTVFRSESDGVTVHWIQ